MILNTITNGIVLDHITAGRAMQIYDILRLSELECTVAIIKNADSGKMGKKDILKIFDIIDINLDVLGYIDRGITVSVIKDSKVAERKQLSLPETLNGVIKCKNPRCITSTEQDLRHAFRLTEADNGVYRCVFCESRAG
ncbi:MAG: aspartate carbamoyltransferase regulatory subunit [Oscillospiraceae bacterium]|nr:aspartate carbamoyltransferase regulatory subunit [Oscillospiraceae bacterium]